MKTRSPFHYETLFRLSPRIQPKFEDYVISIDDFYESPEEILEWLESRPYPLWKYPHDGVTRNGLDYNDCRIADYPGGEHPAYREKMKTIHAICRKHFWKGRYHCAPVYEFNVFQSRTVEDVKLQHFPHTDSAPDVPDDRSTLNMIVYLDKQESGGTAIYSGDLIPNNESVNLMHPVADTFRIERVIPAKFNRCVIFPGNRIHGAYIEDYGKYSERRGTWRYTQVIFMTPVTGEGKPVGPMV